MAVSFVGLLWVAYALLGFFDSVHNYIAWKIQGCVALGLRCSRVA
tara:strand:- start:1209 stop:1343 length:135 start_codon:yes stop_codon:yes gene_type:complete